MAIGEHADVLEALYRDLNRRRCVHPDPLEFLYGYDCPGDREIVALVASSLAIGRVAGILKSVRAVLDVMGPAPSRYLAGATGAQLARSLEGFRHRFIAGCNVAALLAGSKRLIERHGSLGQCFMGLMQPGDRTVLPALKRFTDHLARAAGDDCRRCLPDPARGGACKRLNLMLRWLVRRDRVDPGGWEAVGAEKLVIPLDTHMHKIALAMGTTRRQSATMRTALEITEAFRLVCPEDPVRYDFALTRLGIRADTDLPSFLEYCRERDEIHA